MRVTGTSITRFRIARLLADDEMWKLVDQVLRLEATATQAHVRYG